MTAGVLRPALGGRAWVPRPGALPPALRSTDVGLLALTLLVGAATGLGAICFRLLIESLTWVFTGTTDYAATPGAVHGWLPGVGRWFVVATPVLAGLLYGPLVHLGARRRAGTGCQRSCTQWRGGAGASLRGWRW